MILICNHSIHNKCAGHTVESHWFTPLHKPQPPNFQSGKGLFAQVHISCWLRRAMAWRPPQRQAHRSKALIKLLGFIPVSVQIHSSLYHKVCLFHARTLIFLLPLPLHSHYPHLHPPLLVFFPMQTHSQKFI